MLVRHFLDSLKAASAAERAEAVAALARAYLYSDLSGQDRAEVESSMTLMLDDPSPVVRRALAEAVAAQREVPHHVVLTLAHDQPEIAAAVVRRSPLLLDAELVDLVGGGCERIRAAAAQRPQLSRAVAAAIAEVADAPVCRLVLESSGAEIAPMTLKRMVERHGRDPELREALLARPDLPLSLRHALIEQLGQALSELVAGRAWLKPERAADVARDACERATLRLACEGREAELTALVRELRDSGRLTTALLLRAVCMGAVPFFEAALAELSAVPVRRVETLARGGRRAALRVLCGKAGLPRMAFPAFAAAVEMHGGMRRSPARSGVTGPAARTVIDHIIMRCAAEGADDRLLVLLRRFAAEAACEAARLAAEPRDEAA